jgi:tetratricopeptide (TPR) repeat protein
MTSNRVLWVLLLLLITGCSTGLNQRWVDFNAYYNTYYNAKLSYNKGVRLMENQTVTINTARPIRVHRTPVRAGQADFDRAIEKAADVLRNHEDSKWIDDALELIGKSYFQLSQFFSAEQKFNEIFAASANPQVRQRAVLWKGRIFLETNRYNEGIRYLNATIASEEYDWNPQILAELQLVLGQLYVQVENWEEATSALASGISTIRDDELRSRANFLNGQVLERLDRKEEALIAYGGISRKYPEYQLILMANLKRAEINRALGNLDRSYRDLYAMSRDDKNFEQIGDINYEIGRTLQFKGQPTEAFEIFEDVLYNSIRPPTRETIAKTHYAIAELYRYNFNDFTMAAAYYDSSARSATDLSRLPKEFDASELATSFGDYARLSSEIHRLDSLMWLGSLPRAQFDSVLTRIRDQRLQEYQRQMRQDQLRGTTLVNTNQGANQPSQQNTQQSGFLNHRNPVLVAQAAESFAALWDGRALVDDWRRLQAVRQQAAVIAQQQQTDDTTSPAGINGTNQISSVAIPTELNIDLSVIPFTEADKNKMRESIASYEYQLGNVFYLNLGMPDSAITHYQRVVNEFTTAPIRPQAMYTVADIYISYNDMDSAIEWANRIVNTYPASTVAQRIVSRLNLDVELDAAFVTDEEMAKRDYNLMLEGFSDASPHERIAKTNLFIKEHPTAPQRPEALFSKALAYAELGREIPEFEINSRLRVERKEEWQLKKEAFDLKREEAQVLLSDTTLAEEVRAPLLALVDSTFSEPNFDNYFPFKGAPWDSARVALSEITTKYPQSRVNARAQNMLGVLALPESLKPAVQTEVEVVAAQTIPDDAEIASVECDLLDNPISLVNGQRQFLEETGFMDILNEQGILSANYEFQVSVNANGEVVNVRSLTRNDPMNLAEGLRTLISNQARFTPPRSEGAPVQTSCYFVISIENE